MKLIVGLGNPGEQYENTRHNVGFYLLDKYTQEKGLNFKFEKKFNAEIAKDGDNYFMKPQTFMNKSGDSVSKFINYYELDLNDLTVIHDDVDVEVGDIKRHKARGSAGHKGVQDIINKLGSNGFNRLRVGVGKPDNPNIETDDWVLMKYDISTHILPNDMIDTCLALNINL